MFSEHAGMSGFSARFMMQLQYIPAEIHFLETRFNILTQLNVIHFCLWLHSSKRELQINRSSWTTHVYCMCLNLYFASRRLFVRRPIYLSEHILGEMSEQYWQRPIGRRVHILFTLHTSCSFNSGKLLCLKKGCHYFVTQRPRWHLQQITSPAKRNTTEKIWSHVLNEEKKSLHRKNQIIVCKMRYNV